MGIKPKHYSGIVSLYVEQRCKDVWVCDCMGLA